MTRAPAITSGTRVALSRAFLRSTGQFTGRAPFRRGHVLSLETLCPGFTLADVRWDDGAAGRVNVRNLVRENRIRQEPQ